MYKFKVSPDDDKSYTVVSNNRDVLAWERQKPTRAAQQLSENVHLADLYWIAHRAAKRQGLYGGTLKDFEETCDVDVLGPADDDEDEAGDGSDPTQSDR